MATAERLNGLTRTGRLLQQGAVARVGRVSRARVTQIMNLLFLAPEIQARLLFLSVANGGQSPILLRHLQPIA